MLKVEVTIAADCGDDHNHHDNGDHGGKENERIEAWKKATESLLAYNEIIFL